MKSLFSRKDKQPTFHCYKRLALKEMMRFNITAAFSNMPNPGTLKNLCFYKRQLFLK